MIAAVCIGALLLSDPDSGRILCDDGRVVEFRLHGWDAPETDLERTPGACPRCARCPAEAALGQAWTAAAKAAFDGARVRWAGHVYHDAHGRSVSDPVLVSAGERLSAAIAARGWIAPWGYDAGDPKPDWCAG